MKTREFLIKSYNNNDSIRNDNIIMVTKAENKNYKNYFKNDA
jgi:hypothetical protein